MTPDPRDAEIELDLSDDVGEDLLTPTGELTPAQQPEENLEPVVVSGVQTPELILPSGVLTPEEHELAIEAGNVYYGRLTELMTLAPYGIALIDLEAAGEPCMYANTAFEQCFGYGPEELIGKAWTEWLVSPAGDVQTLVLQESIRIAMATRLWEFREAAASAHDYKKLLQVLFLPVAKDSQCGITHYLLIVLAHGGAHRATVLGSPALAPMLLPKAVKTVPTARLLAAVAGMTAVHVMDSAHARGSTLGRMRMGAQDSIASSQAYRGKISGTVLDLAQTLPAVATGTGILVSVAALAAAAAAVTAATARKAALAAVAAAADAKAAAETKAAEAARAERAAAELILGTSLTGQAASKASATEAAAAAAASAAAVVVAAVAAAAVAEAEAEALDAAILSMSLKNGGKKETAVSQRFLSRKSRFASGTPPKYVSPRRSATGSDVLDLGFRTGDSSPGTATPISLGALTPISVGNMTPLRMESGLVRALTASTSGASTPSHLGGLESPGGAGTPGPKKEMKKEVWLMQIRKHVTSTLKELQPEHFPPTTPERPVSPSESGTPQLRSARVSES